MALIASGGVQAIHSAAPPSQVSRRCNRDAEAVSAGKISIASGVVLQAGGRADHGRPERRHWPVHNAAGGPLMPCTCTHPLFKHALIIQTYFRFTMLQVGPQCM